MKTEKEVLFERLKALIFALQSTNDLQNTIKLFDTKIYDVKNGIENLSSEDKEWIEKKWFDFSKSEFSKYVEHVTSLFG